jgi:HAD superfamily hydrolase (TIGR01509 family)
MPGGEEQMGRFHRPAAVIFDMDGVLLDSGAHHREAWSRMLGELGVATQPGFWRRTIGRPAVEAVPLLLGEPVAPAEARRLANRKHQHYVTLAARGMPAVAGVAAFVGTLRARAVPLAVATSARRHDVIELLGPLGLLACFDAIVAAEDVTRGKPDPEVYLLAARRLDTPPDRCLVFEDAIVGVQAARGAGMRVVGVATAYEPADLLAAGAERAIATFEGLAWPL